MGPLTVSYTHLDVYKRQTIAYGILENHNTSGSMEKLKIKFDKLTSHDITLFNEKNTCGTKSGACKWNKKS